MATIWFWSVRKTLLRFSMWIEMIFFLFACLIIPPFVLICPSPVSSVFGGFFPALSSLAGLLLLMQACSQLPAVIRPVLGYPENKMLLLDSWTCAVSVPLPLFYTSFRCKQCLRGPSTKKPCAASQRRSDICPDATDLSSPSCHPLARPAAKCTVNSSEPES